MGVFDSSAARIAVIGVAGTDATDSLVAKLEHAGQVETPARPQPLGEDHDVWVVDYDCLENRARREWTNKLTGDPARRSRALFMSGAATMDTLAELLGPGLVSHLAANHGGDEDSVLLTVRKMLGPVTFGLGQYIPAPTSSKLFTVDGSGAVRGLLGNLETTLVELRVLSRLREAFLFAAGELLTNAVYDAPVDGTGRPRYLNWSRTRSVVLGPEAIVDVEVRVDERRMGISVVDRFGSLSPESVLRYLAKCLRRDDQQVDDKLGGAGMGLFYVLMSVSHLVFNIEPGRRTEAIAILELRPSYRDFAVRAKSFDIFTVGSPNG